jgi:hypothetical protein
MDRWSIFRNNFVAQNQNMARYQMRKKDGSMGINTKLLWADAGEAYRAQTGKPRSEHKVYDNVGKSLHKSYMYRLHKDRDAYKQLFDDEYTYMKTKKRHFTPYQLGYRGKYADNPQIRGAPQPKRTKRGGKTKSLTINEMKQILRNKGVQLPVMTQKKAVYQNLLNQATGGSQSVRGKSKKPKTLTINEMKQVLRSKGVQLPINKQKKRYYQNLLNKPASDQMPKLEDIEDNLDDLADEFEILQIYPPGNQYVSPGKREEEGYVSPKKLNLLSSKYPNVSRGYRPSLKFE